MLQTQEINQIDYEQFKQFLEEACGILLGEGKQYLIVSRLTKLLKDEGIASVAELLSAIRRGQPQHLRDAVIDAMTTNETSWFRDGAPFEVLANTLLPEFEQAGSSSLRVWSAACSSGQEPYTISMVMSEYFRRYPGSRLTNAQILATDISASMLTVAKKGEYETVAIGRGLTEARKQQFFKSVNGSWAVNEDIKRRVSFREQNLLSSFAMLGRFDVIFCRNVLIYFSAPRKQDILKRMAQALNPGGCLFLGASETITGYSDDFDMVRTPMGVYYRRR